MWNFSCHSDLPRLHETILTRDKNFKKVNFILLELLCRFLSWIHANPPSGERSLLDASIHLCSRWTWRVVETLVRKGNWNLFSPATSLDSPQVGGWSTSHRRLTLPGPSWLHHPGTKFSKRLPEIWTSLVYRPKYGPIISVCEDNL